MRRAAAAFRLAAACGALTAAHPGIAQDAVVLETSTAPIRVVTIAEGLDSPWAFEFLPNGDLLVTERPGRLRLISGGVLQPRAIPGVPEVQYKLHGGLMDLALHPQFVRNHVLYLTYSKPGGDEGSRTALLRARYEGGRLLDARDIFVADPPSALDVNFGSRAIFGRDGTIYVSVGDRGPNGEALAQDLGTHNGKIVRLRDDGSVPGDNPFVGRGDALPEIYSYGHRNPQGFTLHPDTGELWASEHGPLGGDEINVINAGANYGWPIVSFGRKYDGDVITDRPWREGMEQPRYFWVPSIGISGLLFYTGDRFPDWHGELFVTGMSGLMVQRVRMQGRGTHERESLLTPLRLEFRDILQGPDGLIYVLARQNAARSERSGAVLRIEPASENQREDTDDDDEPDQKNDADSAA